MKKVNKMTAIWMTPAEFDRLNRLVARVAKSTVGGRTSRSAIIREALNRMAAKEGVK